MRYFCSLEGGIYSATTVRSQAKTDSPGERGGEGSQDKWRWKSHRFEADETTQDVHKKNLVNRGISVTDLVSANLDT